jgi:hypothetical protein
MPENGRKSFGAVFRSLWFWSILFFLSTFFAYATAESNLFYRDWLIAVEFLASLVSGAGACVVLYKMIVEEK